MKIAPHYQAPTIHVLDASRAVGVVSNLTSATRKDDFLEAVRSEYEEVRVRHATAGERGPALTLTEARTAKYRIDWVEAAPSKPNFLGLQVFESYPLSELVSRIDWTPFFQAWELAGNYPSILEDKKVGHAARQLFSDAEVMMARIVEEKWLTANGVLGFFPPNVVMALIHI